MRSKKVSVRLTAVLAIFIVSLVVTSTRAVAQKEEVLHSFYNSSEQAFPSASLIFDASGNLYGTTLLGGAKGYGSVFELKPEAGEGWTEKVLHSFNYNDKDGIYPYADLIFDAAGNLYGTTNRGGAYDFGTVFELMPTAGGGWAERQIHTFNDDGKDGIEPFAGLVFDAAGNLYGTTQEGGAYNAGTVFELEPATGGDWAERICIPSTTTVRTGASPTAV